MGRKAEIRRQAICDMVNQNGAVNLAELKKRFPSVSEVTIRKDLQHLDELGQIIRVHGGAKAMPQNLNYNYRSGMHQGEKGVIAQKAAKLLQPNHTIFITAGSTCVELAKRLPDMQLYAATDGLYTAMSMPKRENLTVLLLGGEVNLNTMRTEGLEVLERLEGMHFNMAFLGTPGFHPDYGFTYYSDMTAAVLGKVVENSDQVVMLMDSSKVNYALMPRRLPLEAIDIVVTDDQLEPHIREELGKKGIEVL